MSGRWREVVRLKFQGQRFHDRALDLSALAELSQFQRIVAETASVLWRAAHPERERLPAHFDDRTRLFLRRVDEGSAVAPLEVFIEDPETPELFEPEVPELDEAIKLTRTVFFAAAADEPLPDNFPRSLVPEYERFGQDLREDESIEIQPVSGNQVARVSATSRARLAALVQTTYEAQADLVGEILEADVRQRRFQLWVDEKTPVTGPFPPEMEDRVTTALREHRETRVRVRGRAEFSPQGRPIRILSLDSWEMAPIEGGAAAVSAPRVEDMLQDLASEIPVEDWKQLPPDLSSNLDHYLYGTPKRR
jgi:hypothetical protein